MIAYSRNFAYDMELKRTNSLIRVLNILTNYEGKKAGKKVSAVSRALIDALEQQDYMVIDGVYKELQGKHVLDLCADIYRDTDDEMYYAQKQFAEEHGIDLDSDLADYIDWDAVLEYRRLDYLVGTDPKSQRVFYFTRPNIYIGDKRHDYKK